MNASSGAIVASCVSLQSSEWSCRGRSHLMTSILCLYCCCRQHCILLLPLWDNSTISSVSSTTTHIAIYILRCMPASQCESGRHPLTIDVRCAPYCISAICTPSLRQFSSFNTKALNFSVWGPGGGGRQRMSGLCLYVRAWRCWCECCSVAVFLGVGGGWQRKKKLLRSQLAPLLRHI